MPLHHRPTFGRAARIPVSRVEDRNRSGPVNPAAINSGDTSWVLFCAAAVLFMTPGLALFYAGMVSRRNTLVMLQQNFVSLGLISLTWVLVGYSLAFGNDAGNGLIGDLRQVGLQDLGLAPPPALHTVSTTVAIPTLAFVAYQMMFAIITPVLATGAVASRLKPLGWAVFLALWSILVYPPIAHWLWAPSGLADHPWGAGLGRRHGCPCLGRRRGTCPARRARPAPRLARSRTPATLDPLRRPRGRHLLVRMVRVQRRRRPSGERCGGPGPRQHPGRRSGGHDRVAGRRAVQGRARDGSRWGDRRRCGPRDDHAGGGLRQHDLGRPDRRLGRRRVPRRPAAQDRLQVRRCVGRHRCSLRRRRPGVPARGLLRG